MRRALGSNPGESPGGLALGRVAAKCVEASLVSEVTIGTAVQAMLVGMPVAGSAPNSAIAQP